MPGGTKALGATKHKRVSARLVIAVKQGKTVERGVTAEISVKR